MRQSKRFLKALSLATAVLFLSGCGLFGDDDDDILSEFPVNIIGAKIEFTITSCNGCGMSPGHRVIYEFGPSGQVQGFNTQDNNVISVDSYSYSRSADRRSASVRLNYGGGAAWEDYDLQATGSGDDYWMRGNYDYTGQTPTASATARGTYRVICASCADFGSGGGGGGSGGGGGGGQQTGRVSFYTQSDHGCGTITVTVQGAGSKTITQFNPNGISDCDATIAATFTLPAGEHSYSASCGNLTWGPSTFNISSNGCLMFRLQ